MIADLREVVALIKSGWRNAPVLVVGDVMLDKYIWGEVERISPRRRFRYCGLFSRTTNLAVQPTSR